MRIYGSALRGKLIERACALVLLGPFTNVAQQEKRVAEQFAQREAPHAAAKTKINTHRPSAIMFSIVITRRRLQRECMSIHFTRGLFGAQIGSLREAFVVGTFPNPNYTGRCVPDQPYHSEIYHNAAKWCTGGTPIGVKRTLAKNCDPCARPSPPGTHPAPLFCTITNASDRVPPPLKNLYLTATLTLTLSQSAKLMNRQNLVLPSICLLLMAFLMANRK